MIRLFLIPMRTLLTLSEVAIENENATANAISANANAKLNHKLILKPWQLMPILLLLWKIPLPKRVLPHSR